MSDDRTRQQILEEAAELDVRRQAQVEAARAVSTRLGAHLTKAHAALAAAGLPPTCCEETADQLVAAANKYHDMNKQGTPTVDGE